MTAPPSNDGSKTTTLVMYIADAWSHGAEVFSSCEVTYVKYIESTKKWVVFFKWLQPGCQEFTSRTLIPSRSLYRPTLCSLVPARWGRPKLFFAARQYNAGRSYSGNSDIPAFGYELSAADLAERPGTDQVPASPALATWATIRTCSSDTLWRR
ncbi:hypothetical protein V1506DRAFT_407506 [Lipomyces tetrasporus]